MNYNFVDPNEIASRAIKALRPPPDITVDEWADKYRRLSAESSASPGRFKTDRTEYFREPMQMIGRKDVESVALMTSAQVGKSTLLENAIGYMMHLDPCPILHVSPTLESQKMFSTERLAPMIRDTPVLRGLVKDARARDSGNTLSSKKFPGGHIAMVGSNAPSGLASRPIRMVVADEVDRFERSAGTEGDPLKLALKRTTTFWNAIKIFVSTPGMRYNPQTKLGSRIEKEFLAGDQRYRHCKCPDCGEEQVLKWAQVKWDEGNPLSAYYECEHCGSVWDDHMRNQAVRDGRWIASKPFDGKVSYHLSQLYSPFAKLSAGVADFLDSKNDPELLKTWVNTFLGEPWEERGERLDWSNLMDQKEEYNTKEDIPEEITVITAAVDVQDDRLEYEIIGWGDNTQSWSLEYGQIYGDLSAPQPWRDLDDKLKETFIHPIFGEMSIRNTCIDSGGHYTQDVYNFSELNVRYQAIKGIDGESKPMVGKPMKNTLNNARVFPLGVHTIKETVVARLKVTDPEKNGYCRFPDHYDKDYFMMLVSEELRTKISRGFRKQEWHKIRKRNEVFDLRVYNTAALEMLNIDLNSTRRRMLRELRKESVPVPNSRFIPRKPSSSGGDWVNGWRNG